MKMCDQGSFTAEAAMVMGIVLFVILAVLAGSRFVYDRSVQTAQEYELAILEEKEDPDPITFARRAQLIKEGK